MMKRMWMIGFSVMVLFLLSAPAWSSIGAGMNADGHFILAKGGGHGPGDGSGNGGKRSRRMCGHEY